MTINNKSERNYRGKCLGWPVTSYGAVNNINVTLQARLGQKINRVKQIQNYTMKTTRFP